MHLNYSGTLVVPLSLDARVIEGGFTVNDATAVFDRLPWQSETEVHHPDTPFLGEAVMSPPFQDKNFTMGAGVHLHWILPKSHRTYTTNSESAKAAVPAAPNRWLVTRQSDKKQWIVESDYINLKSKKSFYNEGAVSVPSQNCGQPGVQPYVYLGRQLELSEWLSAPPLTNSETWAGMGKGQLTAFGYGELSFNTYYPNCRSVFGFYDQRPTGFTDTYEVLGWYASPEHDIVAKTNNDLTQLINSNGESDPHLLSLLFEPQGEAKACPSWLSTFIDPSLPHNMWHSAWLKKQGDLSVLNSAGNTKALAQFYQYGISQALSWSLPDFGNNSAQNSVYYGQITTSNTFNPPEFKKVAIGHTGLEALSTYIAGLLNNKTNPVETLEPDLNALMSGAAVQQDLVDIDSNLRETNHNNHFVPEQGELIWIVKKRKKDATEPSPDVMANDLTVDVADLLNELNENQLSYDQAVQLLADQKAQVYDDWCKYMKASYPPLDDVQNLPETDLIKNYVEWEIASFELGTSGKMLAEKQQTIETVKGKLNAKLTAAATASSDYELLEVPGPRYYSPKDPVILFAADSNDVVIANPGNGIAETAYSATASPVMGNNKKPNLITALVKAVAKAATGTGFVSPSTSWSPQLLQWQVEFKPDRAINASGSNDYPADFLTQNFNMPANDFGFSRNHGLSRGAGLEYTGSTYASIGTKGHMQEILETLLLRMYPAKLSKTDFEVPKAGGAKPIIGMEWHTVAGETAEDLTNPACVAFKAYQQLEDLLVITQSLGGFSKAMLQKKHNVKLPIIDPLSFAPYRIFNEMVNDAIGDAQVTAPLPGNYFLPVRSGELELQELALIDHFGIANKASVSDPYIANSLTPSGTDFNNAWLPPAFVSETRLDFRWLSASTPAQGTDIEMNNHPATSPICGWLMPNYLENTLMVYNAAGNGLGSMAFDSNGNYETTDGWSKFEGSSSGIEGFPTKGPDINDHLLAAITAISKDQSGFLPNVQIAQETINPEYFAGHNSMAVLVGKPIAVVRANIGFSYKGKLKHDQGWIPFEQQLTGAEPATLDYDKINVNIKLGDGGQLNDGLIAFAHNNAGTLGGLNWVDEASGNHTIQSNLSAPAQTLTMLMDPHGMVHAISGVLPVKTINIPPEQYTDVLRKLQIIFKTQPILTPASKLQLSLPKEQGYQWSWLQNVQGKTLEIPDMMLISESLFEDAWKAHLSENSLTTPTAATLWPLLTSQAVSWLVPLTNNTQMYQIMPLIDSIKSALSNQSPDTITAIEQVLNSSATGMVPYQYTTNYYPKQELIEGWLRLSETQS